MVDFSRATGTDTDFAFWAAEQAVIERSFMPTPDQLQARIGTIAFQFPAHEANGAEVIDTIFLSCKKCGAIRLHTRDVVTSWLKAHP